jgi:hypothetical protein
MKRKRKSSYLKKKMKRWDYQREKDMILWITLFSHEERQGGGMETTSRVIRGAIS